MNASELSAKILDTMLSHLGIVATIEIQETAEGDCLQIFSSDKDTIIGEDGDRLDDLQYLVNRILRRQMPDAPRVKVDCEHFRSIQEDQLCNEVLEIIKLVKRDKKPYRLKPLNAYYRRLAYQVISADLEVVASSPDGDQRMKRISIACK